MLSEQGLQAGYGGLRISLLKRLDKKRAGQKIEDSIVGLLLTLVRYWYFNAFAGFAPNIATSVSPQQMTFILEENPLTVP